MGEGSSPLPQPKAAPPAWVQRLQAVARQLAPAEFCGKVELNFYEGGVTSTNVTQSYKH